MNLDDANSEKAFARALTGMGLADLVDVVSARSPDLAFTELKPSGVMLSKAIRACGSQGALTIMIGNQVSDVLAAHATEVEAIGLSSKPGRGESMLSAGALASFRTWPPLVRFVTGRLLRV